MSLQEESTEATAPKEEQTLFTVKLIKFNAAKKVALIKEIKNQISGLNLVQVILSIIVFIWKTMRRDLVLLYNNFVINKKCLNSENLKTIVAPKSYWWEC